MAKYEDIQDIPEGHGKLLDKWMSEDSRIVTVIDDSENYGSYKYDAALYITTTLNNKGEAKAMSAYYIFPIINPENDKVEYQISVDLGLAMPGPVDYEAFKTIVSGLLEPIKRRFLK